MNTAMDIIKALTKIQEKSDILERHKKEIFEGISLAEAHCIDKIATIENANVTKIANEMDMTRGAISKITKKLISKNLIDSYQKPENNKEIFFSITDCGNKIYIEHKKCHKLATKMKLSILAKYNDEEQAVILQFLKEINKKYDE